MLPKGWHRSTLGEVAKFLSGNTPSKENAAYWVGDFPWITARDMKTLWLKNATLGLSETGRAVAAIAPPQSILVLTRGMTLLKDLPVCLIERKMAFNQDIKALVPNATVDATFLAYQLLANKNEILDLVDTAGHGTGRLDTDLLKDSVVVVPPLPEQRRIARILSTWDQAITATERLLANNRRQRLALLAATLHVAPATGDVAVKSDNGGFPLSVQPGIPRLPAVPSGWRRVCLGDHLKEVRRPVPVNADDAYTLVTVKRSRGGVQQRAVLRGSEIKTPSQFSVLAGDFLISKRQIVHGACGIVPPALDGALISNEYAVINTDGEIDLDFLRYLSESRYFQQTCFHSSIGVHVEKMIFKTERWLTWPFNIPPPQQQQRIVEILDAATRELELIDGQLASLKQEKRSLMAQLLTGKRRVRLADIAAEAAA